MNARSNKPVALCEATEKFWILRTGLSLRNKLSKPFLQMLSWSILFLYECPKSDSALKKTLIGHYLLIIGDLRKKELFHWIKMNNVCHNRESIITLTVKQQGQQTSTTTFPISTCCHAVVLCKKNIAVISLKLFLSLPLSDHIFCWIFQGLQNQ